MTLIQAFSNVDPRIIHLCTGQYATKTVADQNAENRKDALVTLLARLHTHPSFEHLKAIPYDSWSSKDKRFVKMSFLNILRDILRPNRRYLSNTFDSFDKESATLTDTKASVWDYDELSTDVRYTTALPASCSYDVLTDVLCIKEALRCYTPIERFLLLQSIEASSYEELSRLVEHHYGLVLSVSAIKTKIYRLRDSLQQTLALGYRPDFYKHYTRVNCDVTYTGGRTQPLTGRLTRGYHNYTGEKVLANKLEALKQLIRSNHPIQVPVYFHRKTVLRDPANFRVCWYVSLVDSLNETLAGAGIVVFADKAPMIYERYGYDNTKFFETTAAEVDAMKKFRIVSPDFHQLSELTFRNLVRNYTEEADWS
ncbi:hypothetical protein [Microcystis phage Mvi-JY20]|uniref:Uncharacterized protein n=1 Tax=Microcystis phage Mvi-JY20 TaxID=3128146 RepID=A0AAX4QHY7_9CAUD